LNCVENLPVFGAIVVAAVGAGAHGRGVELAAIAVPCARVVQTVVHVAFAESARTVTVRFSFFAIQILAFFALIVRVVHP
jgi:uncharacterized MAPEG superfamily protein